MKLFITGANGQLGRCLQDRILDSKIFESAAFASDELDITDRDAVLDKVQTTRPDVVINAAAYTAVDSAEDNAEVAFSVNKTGVENLAHVCVQAGKPLIHVSTDYVFDGQASSPYLPDSTTNPIGEYGKSKLEGEIAASRLLDNLVIVRTAWVYSEYGTNFVKTMLRLAETMHEISVVDDQIGCPTYAGNIASAILAVCQNIRDGEPKWGIHHYVDASTMSWCEFARQIFSKAKQSGFLDKDVTVKSIASADYPTRAHRPAYSVLDTETFERDYGFVPAKAEESLEYVLGRLATEANAG